MNGGTPREGFAADRHGPRETSVLSLILILLLLWFVLIVMLAAWSLFFQGYIYSEPSAEMYWRAPAAGSALFVFLTLWVIIDYRAPGRYLTLTEFSPYEYQESYKELRIPTRDGKEE